MKFTGYFVGYDKQYYHAIMFDNNNKKKVFKMEIEKDKLLENVELEKEFELELLENTDYKIIFK